MTMMPTAPQRASNIAARLRIAISAALVVAAAGCSAASTYEERIEYLNTVSARGVELHDLIVAGEGEPNEERCKGLYAGLEEEVPSFEDWGIYEHEEEEAFVAQAEQVFVDSCLSGKSASADLLDVMESGTPNESGTAAT